MANHVSRTNTKWLLMQVIYIVVLTGFAWWCYIDGASWLPARGEADASYKQHRYLQAAEVAGKMRDPRDVSVDDPKAEFARLSDPQQLQILTDKARGGSDTSPGAANNARFELARLEWLQALDRIGKLEKTETTIENPAVKADELDKKWKTNPPPKPLAGYDIPLQWAYLGVTMAVNLAVIFVLVRAMSTRYRYDDQTKTLTLPNGKTISPADLAEVDKRKWEKLRCTVVLNDGARHDMDLLRYVPLEEWILDIEAAAGKGDAPKN